MATEEANKKQGMNFDLSKINILRESIHEKNVHGGGMFQGYNAYLGIDIPNGHETDHYGVSRDGKLIKLAMPKDRDENGKLYGIEDDFNNHIKAEDTFIERLGLDDKSPLREFQKKNLSFSQEVSKCKRKNYWDVAPSYYPEHAERNTRNFAKGAELSEQEMELLMTVTTNKPKKENERTLTSEQLKAISAVVFKVSDAKKEMFWEQENLDDKNDFADFSGKLTKIRNGLINEKRAADIAKNASDGEIEL